MIGKTNALSAAGVELSLVVSITSGAAVTATKSGKDRHRHGGGRLLCSETAGGGYVERVGNAERADFQHAERVRKR